MVLSILFYLYCNVFAINHHVYAPGLFFLLLSSQETHSSQAHIGKRNVSERQRFVSKYALQSLANEFSEKIFRTFGSALPNKRYSNFQVCILKRAPNRFG